MPDAQTLPTLAALLHWARLTPDAPAASWRGTAIGYADLARKVASCASMLTSSGLQPGMWAGLQCDDRLIHMVLVLACEAAGAGSMSITALDLGTDAGLCQSFGLICRDTDEALAPVAGQIRLTTAQAQASLAAGALPDSLKTVWPPETLLRIVRTSGTTGAPKLVPVRAGEIAGRLTIQLYTANRAPIAGIWIALYNFTHASAYHLMLCALATGRTLVFHDLESFVSGFDDLPPFTANVLPAEAAWLAERCARLGKRARPGFLQIGGDALPQALRDAVTSHVASDVQNIYASNETGRIAVVGPDGVGDLVPGAQCRILDEQGRDLPWGEPGIIALHTTAMAAGYLTDPDPGGSRISDGWLITTDLGMMPAPGRLQVLGRRDDMLAIAGTKLAPDPFEARLRTLPGVTDAALISVPDGQDVGRLLIMLHLAPGIRQDGLAELATQVLPRNLGNVDLVFTGPLPRTDTGKLRRAFLRDAWMQHQAAR